MSPSCCFQYSAPAARVVVFVAPDAVVVVVQWSGVSPSTSVSITDSLPSSLSICGLQGIKKPHELMKMSEVIKRGGDGDTDPGRVSEGQEVHMGPRPACSSITLLPSSVPLVPRLHGTQIWLDWPAGHREEGAW